MKPGIHPKVQMATITCGCGATYELLSTKPSMRVEICANCHPFYTGARGTLRVESGSRIEKFRKKYGR
ncbi:MAG: 50S ribosomal protein L31 [Symbiobacteriaceae bacterium]|nr:MAG: 50S ribosomal protein L31 [Bacillota bacterium]